MPTLDSASRQTLLHRARAVIAAAIGVESEASRESPIPNSEARLPTDESRLPTPASRLLDTYRAGAFVTLRLHEDLRGCIGYPEHDRLLLEVVERCAVSAALADPRFPPLTATEWRYAEIEISVLGSIEELHDISEIEIGRHGLIVDMGHRRGLLLPQVAVEWRFSREEFVAQTCAKAGLPRDAWQQAARLFKFEADVFGESE
jgi:AmmeMemoRadiSam system protein A